METPIGAITLWTQCQNTLIVCEPSDSDLYEHTKYIDKIIWYIKTVILYEIVLSEFN